MNDKRLLFIYNAKAGRSLLAPHLAEVIDIFVKAGYEVTVHPTQASRDAMRLVEVTSGDGYDLVVCSGGDGTLDEVVSGMMNRARWRRVPIGYIPAGTTNDFANSLRIPTEIIPSAKNAVNGVAFPCDVGRFEGKTFVYVAAFGLFTDVSYGTDQEVKNLLGHAAYVLEGVRRLASIKSYKMKVTSDRDEIEGEFIYGMVTNSRSVGGFRNIVNKHHVVFDDGEFEVTLIHMPKNPIELNEIITALLIEKLETKYMTTFSTSKVTFECDELVDWTLDGEYGGAYKKATVRNRKQRLKIMVPQDKIHLISETYAHEAATHKMLREEEAEEKRRKEEAEETKRLEEAEEVKRVQEAEEVKRVQEAGETKRIEEVEE